MRTLLILPLVFLLGCVSSTITMGLWTPKVPSGMAGEPIFVETCHYNFGIIFPNDRFDTSEILKAALPHGRTALANVTIERTAIHWPYLTYVCFKVTGTAIIYPEGG